MHNKITGTARSRGLLIIQSVRHFAKGLSPSADTFTLESEIASLVYQLYGFTEEELDFTIRSALPLASSKNYDIKYRMGDELGEDGKSSSILTKIHANMKKRKR